MAERHEESAPYLGQFFRALHEVYGARAVEEIGRIVLFLSDQAELEAKTPLPLQARDAAECARRYNLLESGSSAFIPKNAGLTVRAVTALAGEDVPQPAVDIDHPDHPFNPIAPVGELAGFVLGYEIIARSMGRAAASDLFLGTELLFHRRP